MLKVALFVVFFIGIFLALIFGLFIVSGNKTNEEPSNNSMTLEEKVDYYNAHMSEDEKRYRECCGLGGDTYGEWYNPMGNGGSYHE